ncbi:hypothetical protein D9C73_017357 [Collichthys lucidus]|uniref:Uncharacterized protein n=1 Tax=Collichthys lucidus TaxID=240159 RepID=A0A4U5V5T5_COLLU|nr:hypothetical protein D9C73_017357 [Collichthys lucidus]
MFLTPCEDDENAVAKDELQRLTDNQASFSPSFISYFAHSDGQKKMSVVNGKTVKDDNTKGETEVKNATTEVKTVPNEAPQANGNESKA